MLPASGGSTSYDTGGEIAAIPVSTQPFYGDFDPVNGDIYVADDGSSSVNVISGSTNALVDTITVGSDPVDVAYDSVNGDLYETNFASATVSIILGGTNTVSGSLSVGSQPYGVAVDTANGNVYVAERGANAVIEISEATNTVANTITVGSDPEGVAYDSGNGEIYVTNEGTDTVSVISTFSNAVVSTITVGNEPYWVAFDGQNGNLYVANFNSATLSVVSGTTNSVTATITVIEEPDSVAYDSGNGDLYVDDGFGPVEAVSTATDSVVATFPQASYAQGTIYDSANGDVYASVTDSDTELVISTMLAVQPLTADLRGMPTVGSVTASIALGGSTSPQYLAFDPVSDDVFVADADANEVSVIWAPGNIVVATEPVGDLPFGVVYDGGNGDVYVTNLDSNTVSVISGVNDAVIGTISVGSQPYGLAYDSGNGDVYVTNSGTDTVSVISGATNEVVATTTVGADPLEATYDSGNGNVYVTNIGTDTVSVIAGATNTVIDTIVVGEEPFGVAYDSANGDLYVAIDSEDQVSVISGASETIVAVIEIAAYPYDIAYDSANGFLYVTTYGAETTIVLSGESNQVVGTISIPYTPYGIAYDDESGTIYVTNSGYGIITAVSTLSSTVSSPPASMDVGQSLLFSSSLSGQGAGGDVPTVSTSPSTGITCAINPLGYTIVSGACLPSSAGEYTVTLTVEDELGTTVSTSMGVTVYADPSVSTPSLSSASVDVGQTASFSVSATGGTGSYVFDWSGLPSGCANVNSPTLTCTPSSTVASPFTIFASVTDSNDYFVSSATTTFAVYSDPSAGSIVSSLPSADVGQSVGFGISVSGGTGVYSYVWEQLPGCNTADSSTLSCTPTTTGTSYTYVQVTDSDGYTFDSAGIYFTVSPAPTIQAISASTTSLDVGQSVTLSTVVTAGSGSPVTAWAGLPAGCLSSNALTIFCSPATSGTFRVSASVQDSNGMNVSTTAPINLVVSAPPALSSLSASSSVLDVGQAVTFAASGSSGSGGLTYSWTGLPRGCSSSASWSISCTPTGTGVFSSIDLLVTDSNGASATWATPVSVTVWADPSIATPSASPASLDVGQKVTLGSVASVPAGGPTYAWTGLPSGCTGTATLTVSCTPTAGQVGSYSISVSVTDSNGFTVTSSAVSLVVAALPTVTSLAASRTALDVGQVVTLTAAGTVGSGGLQFTWGGLPAGCAGANIWSFSCAPSAPGSFPVVLTVTDSNGGSASWSSAVTIVVSADPYAPAPAVSSNPIDVGQSVILTAHATPVSGSNTFWWWDLPTGCLSSNSVSITCVPSAPGSYSFGYTVMDSNGLNATSGMDVLSVSPHLGVPTVASSSGALDVGSSLTLSATIAGGTPEYTYVWAGLPAGCASQDAAALLCVPSTSGSASVTVTVTDSVASSQTSSPLDLTVSAAPTAGTPSASRASLDVGQTTSLTVLATTGTATSTITWAGLPTGCTSSSQSTISCTPTAAGLYTIWVTVTDANGVSAASPSLTLDVAPALGTATLTTSSSVLDVGASVSLAANAVGGSGGDQYAWSGLPAGCVGASAPSLNCPPTASGTFSPSVSITDSNGASVSATASLTVNPALAVSVSASPTSAMSGSTLTFTATATGGTGTPTYAWYLNGSLVAGTTGNTLTLADAKGGSYVVWVALADTTGVKVASSAVTVQVSSPASSSTSTTPSSSTSVTAQVSPLEEDSLIGMLVLLAVIAVLLMALLLTRPKPPAPSSGGSVPPDEPAPSPRPKSVEKSDAGAGVSAPAEDFREG